VHPTLIDLSHCWEARIGGGGGGAAPDGRGSDAENWNCWLSAGSVVLWMYCAIALRCAGRTDAKDFFFGYYDFHRVFSAAAPPTATPYTAQHGSSHGTHTAQYSDI
jgi:hypothetical protein